MNKSGSKIIFLASALIVLLILSGCGLNQRSASQSDPVPVQPIDVNVTEPTADPGTTDPAPADNSGDAGTTDGNGATDPAQPAADGAVDPYASPETPRDDGTTDGQPADNSGQTDGGGEGEQPTDNSGQTDQTATESPTAEPTVAPVTQPPATTAPGGTHVVQAGETLFKIALNYGLTLDELARANNIANVNIVSVGQELVIPAAGSVDTTQAASVHIVSYGDTIYNIAGRYGVTVEEIQAINGLANVNRIDIGQEIKIPAR